MSPTLYLLQRGTAALLAPLVLTHLVLIVLAVQGGLTAEEIFARTSGSIGWALFYGVFVLAAGIHAGIGLQAILAEWTGLGRRGAAIFGHVFMLVLVVLGFRAVFAVVTA